MASDSVSVPLPAAELVRASALFPTQSSQGLVASFFPFLEGLRLNVPSTLIWHGPYLDAYYHTVNGSVVRTPGDSLPPGALVELLSAFSARQIEGLDIVATWTHQGSSSARRGKRHGGPALSTSYLTQAELEERLHRGPGAGVPIFSVSMLQRFLPPKGAYNHAVTTAWTPEQGLAVAAQHSSLSPMLDASLPLPLRLALDTGQPPTPLAGPQQLATLRDACLAMANAAAAATSNQCRLASLTCTWKTGDDGRLYLLHAAQVAVEDSSPEDRALALAQRIEGQGAAMAAAAGSSRLQGPAATALGFTAAAGGAAGASQLRPPTAVLATASEAVLAAGRLGRPSTTTRALNQDLLAGIQASKQAAAAAAAAEAAAAAKRLSARSKREAVRNDLALIHQHFAPASQCPCCGNGLEEGWVDASAPASAAAAGLPTTYRQLILYHEAVLLALGREPYNDSVPSAYYKGTAFDVPAAAAMARQPCHYLPLLKHLGPATGGGVGFFGAVLLHPPLAPPPAQARKRPPRSVTSGTDFPSVFHTLLPVPEFRVADEARYARQLALKAARAEAAAAAVQEQEQEAAMAVLGFLEDAKRLTLAPEVPPPLALLLRGQQLDVAAYRGLRGDVFFTSTVCHTCARCHAILGAVEALGEAGRRAGGALEAVQAGVLQHAAQLARCEEQQQRRAAEEAARVEEERRRWGRAGRPQEVQEAVGGNIFESLLRSAASAREEEAAAVRSSPSPLSLEPLLDEDTQLLVQKELASGRSIAAVQAEVEAARMGRYLQALDKEVTRLGGKSTPSAAATAAAAAAATPATAAEAREWLSETLGAPVAATPPPSTLALSDASLSATARAALEIMAAEVARVEAARPPLPKPVVPSPAATVHCQPMLEQAQRVGINPLLPSSLFPKPEGHQYPRSPLLPPQHTAAASPSSKQPPLSPSPLTPTPRRSPPSRAAPGPLTSLMESFALANGLPSPSLTRTERSPALSPALSPAGKAYPALPAFWDDSVGVWSTEGVQQQPHPATGILAVATVRMAPVDYSPAAAAAAAAAALEEIRASNSRPPSASPGSSRPGSRGDNSRPGSRAASRPGSRGGVGVGVGGGGPPALPPPPPPTPPYLVILRRAHECELAGMVWKHPPAPGFEATPFALHMVSSVSGRGLVEWMRVQDMRRSINPLVQQVLAQAEALHRKEEAAAAAEAAASAAGAASDASSASAAAPAAPDSAGKRPSKPGRDAFLPPPALLPHVALMAVLPVSGQAGVARGRSQALAHVGGGQEVPPAVFLHDTPRTTMPVPIPKAASRSAHTPGAFAFCLLAVAMPEVALAALPGSAVPCPPAPGSKAAAKGSSSSTSSTSASTSAATALPLLQSNKHGDPTVFLPPTVQAARAYHCTRSTRLLPAATVRQPLFLLRRFHPATGTVELQRQPPPAAAAATTSSAAAEQAQAQAQAQAPPAKETWLTFAQLCAPALAVHPTLLYAARCRLLALLGAPGGYRFSKASTGSAPTPGAVQRLLPGHFLRGAGSLDRARGYVADGASLAAASLASMRLRVECAEAGAAFQAWSLERRRLSEMMVSRGLSGEEVGSSALVSQPPPALTAVTPLARAPQTFAEMRPVDIKTALEVHELFELSAAEELFWREGESAEGGLIARRLITRSDGSVLHCQLSAGFPEEQGMSEGLLLQEKRARQEAARTGGAIDPVLLAAIARSQSASANFMFRLRVFASNTGVVTSRWVPTRDMLQPLLDPHAYDHGLGEEAEGCRLPGNPFLEPEGLLAACGTPVAPREVLIATRFCANKDVQLWVGGGGGMQPSVEEARRHPFGPHASVALGGMYAVTLWVRPERPPAWEEAAEVAAEAAAKAEGGGRGSSSSSSSSTAADSAAWEWDEQDEGFPVQASGSATLTMAQSYAAAGRDSGQLGRHARQRRNLPRFTLRAHYLRQPCPAWETPEEHDARMTTVAGVRKGARMAISQFKHWTLTGNFPSSARLPRITTREHVFAAAFPRVRLQPYGMVQPWMEPVYAYKCTLQELAQTAINPLLEGMPKAQSKPKMAVPTSPLHTARTAGTE